MKIAFEWWIRKCIAFFLYKSLMVEYKFTQYQGFQLLSNKTFETCFSLLKLRKAWVSSLLLFMKSLADSRWLALFKFIIEHSKTILKTNFLFLAVQITTNKPPWFLEAQTLFINIYSSHVLILLFLRELTLILLTKNMWT